MKPSQSVRRVHLFRNGRNQALRIPREFELPGDEALLRRDAKTGRLIVEPVRRRDILDVIKSWRGETEEFPEVEDLPADDVDL
ncbi:MAG TPA: hypothetical protein VJT08_03975 [Terriglobales bacterium]|nr:hypothetical protein [Terriglobales bacterium]